LYRVYPTEFAGSNQNLKKKLSEHQIDQSKRKFSQKNKCFVSSKCKGAKNSYGDYFTEFVGSTQNLKKIVRTLNQTNQNKKKSQKSVKEPKIRMGANHNIKSTKRCILKV
jgi:hypothetical protein